MMMRWHTRLLERFTTYNEDMMKDLGALPLVLRIRMIPIWQEKNIGIFMKIAIIFCPKFQQCLMGNMILILGEF